MPEEAPITVIITAPPASLVVAVQKITAPITVAVTPPPIIAVTVDPRATGPAGANAEIVHLSLAAYLALAPRVVPDADQYWFEVGVRRTRPCSTRFWPVAAS